MIFSALSDRSEKENITLIIVVVMSIMILRGNYCCSYDYYDIKGKLLILCSWVNIQFKGKLVYFSYSGRIYELCGSKFVLFCPMGNMIN